MMKKPRAGDLALLAIVVYEFLAPPGELISEALDRKLERLPLITELVIAYAALHCANRLPVKYDLFFIAAKAMGRVAKEALEDAR